MTKTIEIPFEKRIETIETFMKDFKKLNRKNSKFADTFNSKYDTKVIINKAQNPYEIEITKDNFFENTFANFTQLNDNEIPTTVPDFVSPSGSSYWYADGGVIRHSDHWGMEIATCSWFLDNCHSNKNTYAFCKFEDFYFKADKVKRQYEVIRLKNTNYELHAKHLGFEVVEFVNENTNCNVYVFDGKNVKLQSGRFLKQTTTEVIFDTFKIEKNINTFIIPN